MKPLGFILVILLLTVSAISSNQGVETMSQDKKRGFVIITKPRFIQGIGCFEKNAMMISGICEPGDSEILLEIIGYSSQSCKARNGKWQIELPNTPNTLFKVQVKLAAHPGIMETVCMINYFDTLPVIKEINETPELFSFTIQVPNDCPLEARFQVQALETMLGRTQLVKELSRNQIQKSKFSIPKNKLKNGENLLVLVMKTDRKNIYSAPISVDNYEPLSPKAIATNSLSGKLVDNFYHQECKGLSDKEAAKKIVDFLLIQKGVKNVQINGHEISWETTDGIGMIFSLLPPDVD